MTAAVPLEVDAGYPEDLRVALAQVYETARPFSDSEVHALRAALNIALQHVKVDPVLPEIVIQWASEDIDFTVTYMGDEVARRVSEGDVYFVCPLCWYVGNPTFVTDAIETASVEAQMDPDGDLGFWRGGYETTADDGSTRLWCGKCYQPLAAPDWVTFDD